MQVGQNSGPIGIFGRYHSLTLIFDQPVAGHHIIAQDLASDILQNITRLVRIVGDYVMISGTVIDRIGRNATTSGDKSDPGLVLAIRTN